MHNKSFAFATILLALTLGACAEDEHAHEPPPVEETVFGDMTQTIDKARSVEETTLQHKEELDRRLQESEQ